jgi:nucleotide-binding universal stress UspA family protein
LIVVGYDGSDGGRAALEEAAKLAADLHCPVTVAYCYGITPLGGEVQDLSTALREVGERETARAIERLHAAGVEAEVVLVDDRPAEGLVRLADERDARMIVVGSHGEKPLRGALVGSTPHRLLHLSDRPVLVVRGAA